MDLMNEGARMLRGAWIPLPMCVDPFSTYRCTRKVSTFVALASSAFESLHAQVYKPWCTCTQKYYNCFLWQSNLSMHVAIKLFLHDSLYKVF